ncbi:MAG: DUF2867 domain-containing protein [Campylobacteraceae bacterium]|nr:DUF2867 domain-containing protein [Campylobacteraceae bacterium]
MLINKINILQTNANKNSLVYNSFNKIDYRDAFKMKYAKGTFQNIDEYAKVYFLSQPTWLRLISMNTISKQKIVDSLNQSNFKIDSNIGSWKIFSRNDKEIVFGDSMGFLDYRFSMSLDKTKADVIEVSTVIKLNGFMGKYYFAVVRLMHRKFVIISLKNVINSIK